MAHDWRSAYIAQAKSDYAVLITLLADSKVPLCHKLHYLQMTTEKLAKGYLTQPGGTRYAKTHNAFVRFVQTARSVPTIRSACGFDEANAVQFRQYMKQRQEYASKIEDLSPEGSDHANPEYPWLADGNIECPCEYRFTDLKLESPQMVKMLQFLKVCIEVA